MNMPEHFLRMAVDLARKNAECGGRPFGAVIVRSGSVIGTGVNQILSCADPTAHAELSAIRAACRALGSPRLNGCVVYASGQPCPMCLAAIHMTGIREVVYAYSNDDAEPYGLSSAPVYRELALPLSEQSVRIIHYPITPAPQLYDSWRAAMVERA
ncbi:nucleoside deaminase [Pigmentiphaga sp.]|uniref:nucleoside deaminase n=1 Tax=Pigmentiphaga sp. TaxID=1977564 RepID=UPI00128B4682|nr:nucleoside deaminase [Pigmentiphaga sp.]MPS27045.1 nucleoside deaminase [Alcaligenaceae bacterium SAGV5]MPS51880.1 nucleoside deaminase [Alcaligenaceae bacterium SAGV3]MPT56071.1 nucleoside deaminase [Alcaligenaceae bacterium]